MVGGALESQLLHPVAKSIGMQPQNFCRAARPFDDTLRLVQYGDDVAALDFFQRGRDGPVPGGEAEPPPKIHRTPAESAGVRAGIRSGSSSRTELRERITARSMMFCSSLIFPGHE